VVTSILTTTVGALPQVFLPSDLPGVAAAQLGAARPVDSVIIGVYASLAAFFQVWNFGAV